MTLLRCVRTVLADVPALLCDGLHRLAGWPAAGDARLGPLKSKSDRTSSTGGASGLVTGVNMSMAAQRTNMSRAEPRIGTTCAIIEATRIADGKRPHPRHVIPIRHRDGVAQQRVGAKTLEGDPVSWRAKR